MASVAVTSTVVATSGVADSVVAKSGVSSVMATTTLVTTLILSTGILPAFVTANLSPFKAISAVGARVEMQAKAPSMAALGGVYASGYIKATANISAISGLIARGPNTPVLLQAVSGCFSSAAEQAKCTISALTGLTFGAREETGVSISAISGQTAGIREKILCSTNAQAGLTCSGNRLGQATCAALSGATLGIAVKGNAALSALSGLSASGDRPSLGTSLAALSGQTVSGNVKAQQSSAAVSGQTVAVNEQAKIAITALAGLTTAGNVEGKATISAISGQTIAGLEKITSSIVAISGQTAAIFEQAKSSIVALAGQTVAGNVEGKVTIRALAGQTVTGLKQAITTSSALSGQTVAGLKQAKVTIAALAGQTVSGEKQAKVTIAAISGQTVTGSGGSSTPTAIAKYLFNEAASGQAPTAALDSSGNALSQTITYNSTSPTYGTITAGRGLTYPNTSLTPTIYSKIIGAGDAVWNGLNGSKKGTIEVVVNYTTTDVDYAQIFGCQYPSSFDDSGFGIYSEHHAVGIEFDSAGVMNDAVFADISSGVHVLHAVFDSTQATATNRIVLYVDGVVKNYTSISQAIALNDTIAFIRTTGTRVTTSGYSGPETPIFFGALYGDALSSAVISTRVTALLANNDA